MGPPDSLPTLAEPCEWAFFQTRSWFGPKVGRILENASFHSGVIVNEERFVKPILGVVQRPAIKNILKKTGQFPRAFQSIRRSELESPSLVDVSPVQSPVATQTRGFRRYPEGFRKPTLSSGRRGEDLPVAAAKASGKNCQYE